MLQLVANKPPKKLTSKSYYVSLKHDGIRCFVKNRQVFTRSNILLDTSIIDFAIPNGIILDCELVCKDMFRPDGHRRDHDDVMAAILEKNIHLLTLKIIDIIENHKSFQKRYDFLLNNFDHDHIVKQFLVYLDDIQDLNEFVRPVLLLGLEGIVVRNPVGKYLSGKRVNNIMFKLKHLM